MQKPPTSPPRDWKLSQLHMIGLTLPAIHSPASQDATSGLADSLIVTGENTNISAPIPMQSSEPYVTISILYDCLQALLQGWAKLDERTDQLETTFDDLIQHVYVLEEENLSLKHNVSQLQLQQDLENRDRRQNLWLWEFPETTCRCTFKGSISYLTVWWWVINIYTANSVQNKCLTQKLNKQL